MEIEKRLMTEAEAAKFLRLSVSWIQKRRGTKNGPPYVKVGGAVRYRKHCLQMWLDAQTVEAAS